MSTLLYGFFGGWGCLLACELLERIRARLAVRHYPPVVAIIGGDGCTTALQWEEVTQLSLEQASLGAEQFAQANTQRS